jgi:hypothetical protein
MRASSFALGASTNKPPNRITNHLNVKSTLEVEIVVSMFIWGRAVASQSCTLSHSPPIVRALFFLTRLQ